MDIKDGIRQFIVEELRWTGDVALLADDYPIIDRQVLDSLGLMEVAAYLERAGDIQVDDIDLVADNFETLAAIAAFVERKQSATAGAVT